VELKIYETFYRGNFVRASMAEQMVEIKKLMKKVLLVVRNLFHQACLL
jgi:hypothetical protein